MIKADDKVEFEGDKGKMEKEKYSNFEELQKRVEILQDLIDEHALILNQNNLVKTVKIEAPSFDSDVLYEKLTEDKKDE